MPAFILQFHCINPNGHYALSDVCLFFHLLEKIMARKIISLLAFAMAAFLTGCAHTSLPSNSVGSVRDGVVVQVNEVRLGASNSSQIGVVGVTGALAGLVANKIAQGSSYGARNAITVVSAAIGGVGGRAAVDAVGAKGYEYVVVLKNQTLTVAQPQADGLFAPGTPVLVLTTGGIHRVVANTAVEPAGVAPVQADRPLTSVAYNNAPPSNVPMTEDGRRVRVIDGIKFYGAKVR